MTVFRTDTAERKYPNGRNADGFQTVSLKGIYPGGWDSQKKESPLEFSGLPSRGGRANPRFPFHILLMYPILGYARGYRPYPKSGGLASLRNSTGGSKTLANIKRSPRTTPDILTFPS